MEHTTAKGFKVTTDDIINLLSCEAAGFDYWGIVQWKSKDIYRLAKEQMIKRGVKPSFGDGYCMEDVEAYMIETGGWQIGVMDYEEDEFHPLTLEMLLNGFELNFINRPFDSSMEDGDANTADCILQYAVFGDVIYG